MTVHSPFSDRTAAIVALVAEGYETPTIAQRLNLTNNGVKYHIDLAYDQLGLQRRQKPGFNSRVLLARWWWENMGTPGLPPQPSPYVTHDDKALDSIAALRGLYE